MREIKNYPGYFLSEDGRVLSKKRTENPRQLKTHSDPYGYPTVFLFKGGSKKQCKIHRLMAETYLENPNKLPLVRHKNDIKTDNRIVNLAWGTWAENTRDAITNGGFKSAKWNRKGEDNGRAKLSDQEILSIRREFSGKRGHRAALARRYGVSGTLISLIVKCKIWKHTISPEETVTPSQIGA